MFFEHVDSIPEFMNKMHSVAKNGATAHLVAPYSSSIEVISKSLDSNNAFKSSSSFFSLLKKRFTINSFGIKSQVQPLSTSFLVFLLI